MPEDLICKLPARLFGYPHTRRQSGCVPRDVAGKVQEQAGKLVGSKEQAVVDPKQTYGPGLPAETMSMGRPAVKAPSRLTLFHSPAGGLWVAQFDRARVAPAEVASARTCVLPNRRTNL
jgi:hypothetical protein